MCATVLQTFRDSSGTLEEHTLEPRDFAKRGVDERAFLALATLALECQSPDIQSTEFSNPESEDDWANQTTTQHETRSSRYGSTARRRRGRQNDSTY